MTLSDLGNLGDFLGGVGVIVTLAYLAIQIRRNTQEMRSASLDAVAASHMEFHRAVWGDPVLNKLWFDGMSGRVALAEDEGRRFLFMVITCARHWERAFHKAAALSTRPRGRGFTRNSRASSRSPGPGSTESASRPCSRPTSSISPSKPFASSGTAAPTIDGHGRRMGPDDTR